MTAGTGPPQGDPNGGPRGPPGFVAEKESRGSQDRGPENAAQSPTRGQRQDPLEGLRSMTPLLCREASRFLDEPMYVRCTRHNYRKGELSEEVDLPPGEGRVGPPWGGSPDPTEDVLLQGPQGRFGGVGYEQGPPGDQDTQHLPEDRSRVFQVVEDTNEGDHCEGILLEGEVMEVGRHPEEVFGAFGHGNRDQRFGVQVQSHELPGRSGQHRGHPSVTASKFQPSLTIEVLGQAGEEFFLQPGGPFPALPLLPQVVPPVVRKDFPGTSPLERW